MSRQFIVSIGLAVALSSAGCAADRPSRTVGTDQLLPVEFETIKARVPRHATLDSLLRQHQLAVGLVEAAVKSATGVFNPRSLRAEHPYRIVRSFDGVLREFEYQIDADNFLRIFIPDLTRPGELEAAVVPTDKETGI